MNPASFRLTHLSKKRNVRPSELTEADKMLAREVWVQVEYNYVVISKCIFTELFRKFPEYKKFFKDLHPDDEDEYLNSQFEKHMIKALMPNLGMIIANLDRPEEMRQHMEKLAMVHIVRAIGITRKHIEVLKEIILDSVKHHLGSGMPPDHEAALRKVLTLALTIMADTIMKHVQVLQQAKRA